MYSIIDFESSASFFKLYNTYISTCHIVYYIYIYMYKYDRVLRYGEEWKLYLQLLIVVGSESINFTRAVVVVGRKEEKREKKRVWEYK